MPEPTQLFVFDEKTARAIAKYVGIRRGQRPNIRDDKSATRLPAGRIIPVKVTGVGADGSVVTHSWIEQQWDSVAGEWIDSPDGANGTTSTNYLVNMPDPTTEISDPVCWAMQWEDADGDDGVGVPLFIKIGGGGSLPTPQYQLMVLQAVSQNQLGADWVRAHDLL